MASTPRSGTRERNRRGQGGRLRDDIVRAGAELLDEAGDEQAVTLRAVARRVGITAPSIYAHFADRQAILLAVAAGAFAELDEQLRRARDAADADPVARLRATCAAYLEFARTRPQRYRVMFGGVWNAEQAVAGGSITQAQATELGQDVLGLLIAELRACVESGASRSTDAAADAVALWLGLHGLAHQRTAAPAFPWPPDIADRLVTTLAHL
ncbi:TetR/AcrR family transcriptional regulator [Pseudonocardia humida]|uniref:TetR/AcrR family transcriptional regulator n=1 Tax=Pseudonocardia humida TaxID=2800819 RepID=A0ABT1A8Z1_9PSEU|nr:TetR/AcrR family transcriptional regulator [Pseudonocardia humida]MCO1659294.1 TetR/AcrR family transcriptional regulator [Pseudonocardia humida]